jgi:hypothetical protein
MTPPSTVNGVRREKNPPTSWWLPSTTSISMPCTRLAKATPHSTAGTHAPTVCAQSHRFRQAGSSILARHSIAQIRTISASRMMSSGRYMPENIVAYHSGNAAKVAPPAVISHTSLPSQTGPMLRSSTRRSRSSRAKGLSSMPTPKSKPSSTR